MNKLKRTSVKPFLCSSVDIGKTNFVIVLIKKEKEKNSNNSDNNKKWPQLIDFVHFKCKKTKTLEICKKLGIFLRDINPKFLNVDYIYIESQYCMFTKMFAIMCHTQAFFQSILISYKNRYNYKIKMVYPRKNLNFYNSSPKLNKSSIILPRYNKSLSNLERRRRNKTITEEFFIEAKERLQYKKRKEEAEIILYYILKENNDIIMLNRYNALNTCSQPRKTDVADSTLQGIKEIIEKFKSTLHVKECFTKNKVKHTIVNVNEKLAIYKIDKSDEINKTDRKRKRINKKILQKKNHYQKRKKIIVSEKNDNDDNKIENKKRKRINTTKIKIKIEKKNNQKKKKKKKKRGELERN